MMEYVIKMIACSGLFMAVYLLLLEKEKMHRFNRFYLLVTAVLSLVIPVIVTSHTVEYVSVPAVPVQLIMDTATGDSHITHAAAGPAVNYLPIAVAVVYGLVSLLLLIRFVYNLSAIIRSAATNETVRQKNALMVLTANVSPPYSFFRYVFLNKVQWNTGVIAPQVMQHELTHVRQLHSMDVLFTELLLISCWINPFFFLYRKCIRLNHEYLADEGVLRCFSDVAAYQYLLIQNAERQPASVLASPFNYLTVKKRIVMMTAKSSFTKKCIKQSTAVVVVIAALFTFSTRAYTQKTEPGKPALAPSSKSADSGKARSNAILVPMKDNLPYGPGAMETMLQEYDGIINKYKMAGEKWQQNFFTTITDAERSRLEAIYLQMNKEQRSVQTIVFRAPFPPLPKTVPSAAQFESFKNAKRYGVWIDGKKVSNAVLNNYVNTDFSQASVSRLYGYALKGKSYTHQLDLMTNAYYQDYYNKTIANKKNTMCIWWQKK